MNPTATPSYHRHCWRSVWSVARSRRRTQTVIIRIFLGGFSTQVFERWSTDGDGVGWNRVLMSPCVHPGSCSGRFKRCRKRSPSYWGASVINLTLTSGLYCSAFGRTIKSRYIGEAIYESEAIGRRRRDVCQTKSETQKGKHNRVKNVCNECNKYSPKYITSPYILPP